MRPAVAQVVNTMQQHYTKLEKKESDNPLQIPSKILINRQKTLQDIKIWKTYLESLNSGNSVENPSPSEDSWFLVPKNIECIICGLESMLEGKGRVIKKVEELCEN